MMGGRVSSCVGEMQMRIRWSQYNPRNADKERGRENERERERRERERVQLELCPRYGERWRVGA